MSKILEQGHKKGHANPVGVEVKRKKKHKKRPRPVIPETSESELDAPLKALQLGRADS
jgi:hypothetical protein